MATNKPIPSDTIQRIVADWRTGQYSQQALAVRYGVSKGLVNKNTKGVEQDLVEIVVRTSEEVQRDQRDQRDRLVNAVTEAVDERTSDQTFFRKASLIVANKAVRKVQAENCTMQDMRHAQEIVSKGKETVLGKSPDTAIQINNSPFQRIERVIIKP